MIDCVQRHVYFCQRNARECILVYSSNNVQETVKKPICLFNSRSACDFWQAPDKFC